MVSKANIVLLYQQLPRLANAHFMPPGANLRVYYCHNDTSSGLHWHEFYELMVVLRGEGVHLFNGQHRRLVPGSLCLLTPSDFHEVAPLPGTSIEFWNIIFTDALLRDSLAELLFDGTGILHTEVSIGVLEGMNADCQRLWDEGQQPLAGGEIIAQATLDRLLVDLRRNLPTHRKEGAALIAPSPIHNALRYIQRHFREPLSLRVAAAQAHLSPAYFSDTFRRTTGTTFQTYVLRLRLQFAAALLGASELPVSDVCFAAGFNSLSHFMRAFKQQFGCSPRAYRQQLAAERSPVTEDNPRSGERLT